MKNSKISYIASALLALFFVIFYNNMAITNPSNPPKNRCGLYGTQATCTACHSASAPNTATAAISVAGNPTSYTPGQTYAITISGTGGLSYGFEAACVRDNNNQNAGTWATVAGVNTGNSTVAGNSIAFVYQSTPNNAGTWTFNWTAPATDVGSVTFYVAVLAANHIGGTGSESGDDVKTVTLTLTPAASCPTLNVAISGNNSICTGQSTSFTATGGATYAWSTGTNNATTAASNAGTYTVTATDANGCTGTSTITLSVVANPTAAIAGNTSFCTGGNTTLIATGGNIYAWNTGVTLAVLNVTAAGTYTVTVTNAAGCTATATRSITVNTAPTAAINGNTSFCAGNSTTLTATGGTNYAWNTGSTNAALNVTAAGTYTVTVTNAAACSSVASVTVAANATPTAAIAGNTSICAGASTTLTASGGTSYSWSTGSLNAALNVTTAGTYTVTVSNALGCSSVANVTVTANSLPTTTVSGGGVICAGASTTLNAGAGFASYNWSNGASTQTTTANTAGTYIVTITNASGCLNTATAVVTQSSPVNVSIPAASVCTGQTTTIDAGAGFTSYSWNTGATTQTVNVPAGNYTVTVSNQNNCTGVGSVTVQANALPTANISGSSTFCAGGATLLDAGAGFTSYLWSNGIATQAISINIAGTYVVTVTNAAGCTASASVAVTQTNALNPSIAPVNVCSGATTVVDAGAGFALYNWNTGATTQTINVGAGTYSVTVSNASGCTGTTSVTVGTSPSPTPTVSGGGNICAGATATLDAGTGFTAYAWSTGATTPTTTANTSGNYTVTVSNAAGCTATANATVTVAAPISVTIPAANACDGQTTQIAANAGFATYNWNTGATTQAITVAAGNYTVTVSNQNACTAVGNVTVGLTLLPVVAISGSNSFCTGNSTTLDAGSGFAAYVWNNSATTQTINVNTAGTYTVTVSNAGACTASANITVSQSNSLNVSIPAASVCNGNTTNINAGAGFNSYTWSNGSNTQSITVVGGTYTVTVSDVSGCTGVGNVTVATNALPILNIGQDVAICAGNSATLGSATTFSSYAWSTGSSLQNITTTTAGTYTLTVTDSNGCTAADAATITVSNSPSVSLSNASVCAGNTTVVNAGAGFSAYNWSNGDNTQTISVGAGTYTVTVTNDNGCTASAQAVVSTNSLPTPSISGSSTFCTGSNTSLNASAGFNSYSWSNGQTTQNITVNAAGTYSVTVTNANGCTGSTSVSVTESNSLNVSLQPTNVCVGNTATIDAGTGFASYAWSNDATTQTITVGAGTYTVTVSTASGCSGSGVVTVGTNALPTPTISGNSSFCAGGSTTLDAGNGYNSYAWSNGATTQTIAVANAGNYIVTVTNNTNCQGVANINVSQSNNLVISIPAVSVCDGNSTIIDAGNGFDNYLWSNGETTQAITVIGGTYTVTVSDISGCIGEGSVIVSTNALPLIGIDGATSFCPNSNTTLTATGGNSYVWSNNSNQATIDIDQAGTYTVTVANNNGCTNVASIVVTQLLDNDPACQSGQVAPIAENISLSLDFSPGNSVIQLSEYVTDPNGDVLTYNVSQPNQGGSLFFDAATGAVTVSIEETFTGLITIPYSVTDGTFTVNATITILVQAALDVSLVRLTAKVKTDGNLVQWTTATETNNHYFTLYSAKNGVDYVQVATINGAGNSNTAKNYEVLDKNTNAGIVYYRLTQTDFDGTTKTIGTVSTTRNIGSFVVALQPNPTANTVQLSFNDTQAATATLLVHDAAGKLVHSQVVATIEGNNTVSLDTNAYTSGIYFVTVRTNTNTSSIRLVKN